MLNMLAVSEEIETKLKDKSLVGSRLGSGFCYINNSRDVQFKYTDDVNKNIKGITNDYQASIEKVVNEVISQYDDLRVCFNYRLDNFSFYISPKIDSNTCKAIECEDSAVDECEKKEEYHNPKDLQMWDNSAELLLDALNYFLNHKSFEYDDVCTFNQLQENLMKLVKKDE